MSQLFILSPLEIETLSLRNHFEVLGHSLTPKKLGPLRAFEIEGREVHLVTGGHGKVQFAISTQYLLQEFSQVRGVICAGCAGALQSQVQVGDLVVGVDTVEHDYHIKFVRRPQPRFKADVQFLEKLKTYAETVKGHALHFGTLASGDEDVLEEERAQEIYTSTKALAVAWEGAGGARASLWNQVPYLELRAISDRADAEGATNFSENLKMAMPRLADALIALL